MKVDLLTVPLRFDHDLVQARRWARQLAALLGLSPLQQTQLTTAVSEIARNALTYGGGGKLELLVDSTAQPPELVARITDRGPGIVDIAEILAGRYRSPTGLGVGLAGSRRLMDSFHIASGAGMGTVVTLGKSLPFGAAPFMPVDGARAMAALTRQSPTDAIDDVKQQSRDLLSTLTELHTQHDEQARLSNELDHTNRGVIALYAELDEKAVTLQRSADRLTLELTERIRLEARLLQSQKMEAVGQLTGGIAHDFNNILMVILANADALLEDEEPTPEVRERLEQIGKATVRAADLTRSLLAFSRQQPLRPQVTDINDLVSNTGKLLRRTLGEQIEIESLLADDLWPVNVDRAQLETAVVNLCINARDAMPGGGRLLIESSNAVLDDDYVQHNPDAASGDYVLLVVSDTGAGIPPAMLSKVFEPFFTTKGVGKGTGLGLSMVHGFIRQSNGHIKIYSELGLGTAIRMYLPRGAGSQVVEEAPALHPIQRGHERILIVEDDPQVRAAVVEQVSSLGYAVAEASSGVAGLAAFESADPPYDLLLTDVVMPGPLNGKAFADEVAHRWPATRILFMSGYTENAVIHHGRLDPGVHLLTKPFRKIDLAQAIRHALQNTDGESALR